jgi:hypothetical protein
VAGEHKPELYVPHSRRAGRAGRGVVRPVRAAVVARQPADAGVLSDGVQPLVHARRRGQVQLEPDEGVHGARAAQPQDAGADAWTTAPATMDDGTGRSVHTAQGRGVAILLLPLFCVCEDTRNNASKLSVFYRDAKQEDRV